MNGQKKNNYGSHDKRNAKPEPWSFSDGVHSGLTMQAETPPTCDMNRESGTQDVNGGCFQRIVKGHWST
jgi:hypothetical protein